MTSQNRKIHFIIDKAKEKTLEIEIEKWKTFTQENKTYKIQEDLNKTFSNCVKEIKLISEDIKTEAEVYYKIDLKKIEDKIEEFFTNLKLDYSSLNFVGEQINTMDFANDNKEVIDKLSLLNENININLDKITKFIKSVKNEIFLVTKKKVENLNKDSEEKSKEIQKKFEKIIMDNIGSMEISFDKYTNLVEENKSYNLEKENKLNFENEKLNEEIENNLKLIKEKETELIKMNRLKEINFSLKNDFDLLLQKEKELNKIKIMESDNYKENLKKYRNDMDELNKQFEIKVEELESFKGYKEKYENLHTKFEEERNKIAKGKLEK